MSAPEKPDLDGSNTIALARRLGIQGVRPAPEPEGDAGQAQAASARADRNSDAGELVSLARKLGLSGIRSDQRIHDPRATSSEPLLQAAAPDPASAAGAESTIALARSVGLAGVRAKPDPSPLSAATVGIPGNPTAPKAVAKAGAGDAMVPPPAPANENQSSRSSYLQVSIIGTDGDRAVRQLEAKHGCFAAATSSGDLWLEREHSGWRNRYFTIPADANTKELVRRSQGPLGSGAEASHYIRLQVVKKLDKTGLKFAGPGASGLPAASLRDREPPLLPDSLLKAISAKKQ